MPHPTGREVVVDGHPFDVGAGEEAVDRVTADESGSADHDVPDGRHRIDSHLAPFAASAGCDTRRCQITAASPSVCGVTRSANSGGMTTHASALGRREPAVPADDAVDGRRRSPTPPPPRRRGSPRCSARGSRHRPRRSAARRPGPSRDPRSHALNTVSQPSSLILAVSSDTLSVGAYASNPHNLRKSLTACPACPAEPPTPRMKSRPPRARTSASPAATASTDVRVERGEDLVGLGEKGGGEGHPAFPLMLSSTRLTASAFVPSCVATRAFMRSPSRVGQGGPVRHGFRASRSRGTVLLQGIPPGRRAR